jgi:16S rRNA processing protein RimM
LNSRGSPFHFIEQKTGNADEPIVKLEGINDPLNAQALQGKNLLFPSNLVKPSKANQVENVVGYTLVDIALGQIGILKALEELPNQIMLITRYKDKDVLIPAVEELIIESDDCRKACLKYKSPCK